MTAASIRWLAAVALALALVADARATDPCKTKCDDWRSACKNDCADAPVVDECTANCRTAYEQCMSDCGLPPAPDKRTDPKSPS